MTHNTWRSKEQRAVRVLLDQTTYGKIRDGFRDVVRVRKRAMVPIISFLEASKTIKREQSRDDMVIDLVLSQPDALRHFDRGTQNLNPNIHCSITSVIGCST